MKLIVLQLLKLIKFPLRHFRSQTEISLNYAQERFCPVCEKSARHFRRFGWMLRQDAQCYHCGALERHRLSWLFITKRTNLLDENPKKMLHVAPEPCFKSKFRQHLGDNYLTADLFDSSTQVKMDITNIDYPDQYFNVIYCSHVLEHVLDDRKAMGEFYRTLKSDGWAILLVPITTEETLENSSITSPIGRWLVFDQIDHVRKYGLDYVDRLREVGFNVEIIKADDLVPNDEAIRMGLTCASGEIYYCTKN
jgi:SAM-dependent methyltransferase